jgi:ornithine cyclodeaminase/alanine dehydrogenase-like protein (mu-crystallin family)
MEKLVACEVKPVSSAREAVESVDVLLTATNSNVPVFSGEWLQAGAHVTSIMGGNVGLACAGVAAKPRRELDDTTI